MNIEIPFNQAGETLKLDRSIDKLIELLKLVHSRETTELVLAEDVQNDIYDLETIEDKCKFVDFCQKKNIEMYELIHPLINQLFEFNERMQAISKTYGMYQMLVTKDIELHVGRKYYGRHHITGDQVWSGRNNVKYKK